MTKVAVQAALRRAGVEGTGSKALRAGRPADKSRVRRTPIQLPGVFNLRRVSRPKDAHSFAGGFQPPATRLFLS